MADIISGKNRFQGNKIFSLKKNNSQSGYNKNEMDEDDYNRYNEDEAATQEDDVAEMNRKIRNHRLKIGILIILCIAAVIVVIAIIKKAIDNYKYTSYTVSGSINREDTQTSRYVAYKDGFITYSNDGISYCTLKGKVLWNQTYSMQNPQVKICQDCVAVGDLNGNTIYMFDESGLIGNADTSLSILQIEVAKQGAVVAVLEDNEANYINMYDTKGNKIYSIKTTLAGDGYPLDISVSDDGTKLMAAYVYVSGEEIKANVVFYNFSDVGQNETERVVGGFNHYEDNIVGDVEFLSDNIAVAIAENVISIYKIKEYPSLEHEIKIDNEIERVFFSEQYIGVVVDNSENGDLYKLMVYNTSGNKVCESTFGIQYDEIQFDGKSVIMNNSNSLVLLNMGGKQLASIDFDMPITQVLPTGTRGSYTIINSKYIQSIKLK
ncbi:MAG: DUF5711 family protein [Lachnospira sp.]